MIRNCILQKIFFFICFDTYYVMSVRLGLRICMTFLSTNLIVSGRFVDPIKFSILFKHLKKMIRFSIKKRLTLVKNVHAILILKTSELPCAWF